YSCPTGPHVPIYPDPRYGPPTLRFTLTLTPDDMRIAERCAELMFNRGETNAFRDRWTTGRSAANNLVGFAGELAFARLTGLPFDCRADGFSAPDVGRYQVRT